MSVGTAYTPLRDDTNARSLSNNERTFLRSCATCTNENSVLRTDGRDPNECRPIRLSYGRSHNLAECTVQLGASTRVSSVVSCHLIPPLNADRPNDGSITFSVDLSPMSCMGFEYAQPVSSLTGGGGGGANSGGGLGGGHSQPQDELQKLLSNRIIRILERTLLNGGTIDAEALCIQSGKWVWRLHVDITILDHGGNLIDASILSTIAALRHFRKPEVDFNEEMGGLPIVLHSDEREPTPLPLHHTPISTTFALFSDPTGATTVVSALIDPTHREELVHDGTITFSFNKYKEMCSLDFPGGCELNPRQFISCAKLAKDKCVELCEMLEKSLKEADEKATSERLDRLVKRRNAMAEISNELETEHATGPVGIPFLEKTKEDMTTVDDSDLVGESVNIVAEEEEQYRIQALDYAQGHVAAKVKENSVSTKSSTAPKSLLEAMLKAVTPSSNTNGNESSVTKTQDKETDKMDIEESQQITPDDENMGTEMDVSESATNDIQNYDKVLDDMNSKAESAINDNKPERTVVEEKTADDNMSKKKIENIQEDDIDDLAMAVKKKGKNKKSKKSKSKK